ncbi:hypothetical protein QZH41_009082 [Actinostola sp. cb2023]|nr:hypothetical protein QZH41_009082 [Actinostola sp. cb2023]
MKNRRKLGISNPTLLRSIRVVILGKDGVGKSALTVRIITKRFIGEYDRTLGKYATGIPHHATGIPQLLWILEMQCFISENTYRHHLEIDNEIITLDIMDTAGINSKAKLDQCVSMGDIFVVLYSITDKATFLEASWIAKCLKKRKPLDSSTLVITGTKQDLEHFRQVQVTDGSKLTHELSCGFYEISISEGYCDTLDMFYDIVRQYVESHKGTDARETLAPISPQSPTSPQSPKTEIKTPSSWSKVKGLRTIPFRRKSVQTV